MGEGKPGGLGFDIKVSKTVRLGLGVSIAEGQHPGN